jgi:hypothetical protein
MRPLWEMNTIISKPGSNYRNSAVQHYDILTSQPWVKADDLTVDLERLIGILVVPHVDRSNPLMHDDELRAECLAKLAYILDGGFLNKCSSRAKAFAFIKTALRNHLRSLVQKYVFTEKRTGNKPPPKSTRVGEVALTPPLQKISYIRLDDEESHFQIGAVDSGFCNAEFLEELNHALTPVERILFGKLLLGEGDLVPWPGSEFSGRQIRALISSIRLKAKRILAATSLNISVDPVNHNIESKPGCADSSEKCGGETKREKPFRSRTRASGHLAKKSVSVHHNVMSQPGILLTREEFYTAVWTTPACHLCKTWSITNSRFVDLCEQFNIPRPGADFWTLIRLGRCVERTPMPQATGEMPGSVKIEPKPKKVVAPKQPEALQTTRAEQTKTGPHSAESPASSADMTVENDFRKAHGLIRMSRAQLEGMTLDRYGRVGPGWREKCVNIVTTKQSLRRALLILDAIFRGLEAKGHKAEVVSNRNQFETGIKVGDEFVRIKIMEKTTQKERELSKEEKTRSYLWDRYIYEPTGILTFSIEEYWVSPQKSWADSIRGKLETLLGEIIEGILASGEKLRLRRIEEQEEQRRYAEEQRKAMELQRLWEQEKSRRQALEQQADLWDKVDRLRAFIGACEARLANKGELGDDSVAPRWLEWARRCADEMDPLNGDYLPNAIRALPANPVRIVPAEVDVH